MVVGMEVAGIHVLPTPAPKPVAVATIAPMAPPTMVPPTLPPARTVAAKPIAVPAPTATPRPSQQAVEMAGKFLPSVLRVGQKLVVELSLTNKSDRPIEGLRIFTTGPWDKYTVVNVMPAGRFESGMLGYNIYSGLIVQPGQTRTVTIVANPNEPGNHEFSFIPNHETTPLNGEDGKGIVIGGKVAVTR